MPSKHSKAPKASVSWHYTLHGFSSHDFSPSVFPRLSFDAVYSNYVTAAIRNLGRQPLWLRLSVYKLVYSRTYLAGTFGWHTS